MRSGFFYYLQNVNRKAQGNYYLTGLFLAVVMLMSSTVSGRTIPTNNPPFFINNDPQYDTLCANTVTDISSLLAILDADMGQTETWSIVSAPTNGTITGLNATATSNGGIVAPTGVTYTPDPGFNGTDLLIVNVDDGHGGSSQNTIYLTVNSEISATILTPAVAVCAGTTSASILFSGLTNVGPDTVVFNTVGDSAFFVPVGISTLNFDVQGARGGFDTVVGVHTTHNPGNGGRVQGTLEVSTGQQLTVYVGGVGGNGTLTGAAGGFNGGASTSFYTFGAGGGGGGASDIRIGAATPADRIVVAGGGGGNGWDDPGPLAGGPGGNLTGGNSAPNASTSVAGGGTQSAGGAGATYALYFPGMNGSFFSGGNGSTEGVSGGGGGGYYGGGGGIWTGGGGGSSYADTTGGLTSSIVYTQGYDTSHGHVVFTYVVPGTYSITWDATAHAAGFRDTLSVPLPLATAGAMSFAVPVISDTTATAVYSGTVTVSTATCSSPAYPITVSVNPIPSVHATANQSVCNGDSTLSDIFFGGSVAGATYTWTNNNTSIGLAANGTNKIAKFLPLNGGSTAPVVADIIVTPSASGCTGAADTFTITDNPIPTLNSTTTPPPVCYGVQFIYNQHSATDSITYTWSRAAVYGVSNTDTSGAGIQITEMLVDTTNVPQQVFYEDTLNYKGCINVELVKVTVYPLPVLTSLLNEPAVCSNTQFDFAQSSNVLGTVITWSRAPVTGISNGAGTGADSLYESLIDTTNLPVTVIYTDTLNYNTCLYTQNVTVTVNPTPVLTSPLIAASTCDTVNYTATSNIPSGTTYAWSRAALSAISPATSNGSSATIYEGLVSNAAVPVVVTYVYTLTASGCPFVESITDTVRPTPTIFNPIPTPDSICSNTIFNYTALSATAGTTYAWSRPLVSNISDTATSGNSATIGEVLINTATFMVPVTYVYTLTAAGCTNVENVVIDILPSPVLSNNPADTAVCDNTPFSYTPASATLGTSYTWTRAFVTGIDDFPKSGTGVASDTLNNTTYVNVNVNYVYTLVSNGCSNIQDVVLTVHPNPTLSSDTVATVCSGGVLNYYPNSYTPTTAFAWTSASVGGITATSNSGIGVIKDTLTSSLSVDTTVVYVYTLTAYGCSNTEDVNVKVNPAPSVPGITTFPSNAACDNTMYQNFGTSTAPAAGMSYTWVADNAQVYAMGAGNQYALVNFNTPGTATVFLVVNNVSTGCLNNNSYTVNVSSAGNSNPAVIYVNGQFICQSTNVDNYQWGYDDASSLDSTILPGETNQNYFNTSPDVNKYYWVITNHGGCEQKSYYQAPNATTGIVNLDAGLKGIKIFPNPAAEAINVEIETTLGGDFKIEVLNMLGQSVNSITTREHSTKIDVAALPAGCYMVDCYRDGAKTATAKFIKN